MTGRNSAAVERALALIAAGSTRAAAAAAAGVSISGLTRAAKRSGAPAGQPGPAGTAVQFSGGFHRVDAITLRLGSDGSNLMLSDGQYRRLARHMCGVRECACGGARGFNVRIDGAPRADVLDALEKK